MTTTYQFTLDAYKKFQKQYVIRIIIAMVVIIATIIMESTYVPYLKKEWTIYFRGYDSLVFYTLTIRVAFAIAVPTLILSVIALWKDIAISGRIKTVMLCIGLLLLVFNVAYLVIALLLIRFGIVLQIPYIITKLLYPFFYSTNTLAFFQMYIMPFCAGILLFFGTAKRGVEPQVKT